MSPAPELQPGSNPALDAPLLRVVGLSKRFGSLTANRQITLEVRHGEVHALLGENGAGKTTLMNIVYGLYRPDEGRIEMRGEPVNIKTPQDAVRLGIGMVHQHFALVPDMTVAENIALRPSLLPRRTGLRKVAARITEIGTMFGLNVDPQRRIDELSVGERQRVEIVKTLYRRADLLILDEPSASLTPPEWEQLAFFLRALVEDGKSVVLITHKLDEIIGVADRCSVLRDGALVKTVDVADTSESELARLMVGREVSLRIPRPAQRSTKPVLEVRTLGASHGGRPVLQDISFDVREGEILGVAGVAGNGQHELVDTLIGLRRPTTGEIWIQGRRCEDLTPQGFAAAGGAHIPEDRHHAGLALRLTVWENIVLKRFAGQPFSKHHLVNRAAAREFASALMTEYGIRAASVDLPVAQLSGGNQQKLVFARELSADPRLLIASQPTRGLDIGAMEFVYRRLDERRQAGAAILLFSNELNQILELSDRIGVMFGGQLAAILDADDADPEEIGMLMAGQRR